MFSGDREAYDEAFQEFSKERRHEALNEAYLVDLFGGDHWFQRNHDHFIQLVDLMAKGEVVPFIGAGVSASGGFPSWKDHLREQGRTANIDSSHIEALLESGAYEQVLEEIEGVRGRDVFIQEIRDVFSRTGTITEAVWRISEVFTDTLITTNYDRLIEQAFDTGEEDTVQIINGMNALETPDPNKTTIIKLHGNILKPERCILSKNQYDDAYGNGTLDMHKALPKLLSYHYKNSSLLFLGCSLMNDRTVQVFSKVKEGMGEEEETRQHFSIEQAPEDREELAKRNADLAKLGITPIWFKKGSYEYVESILRLAQNELRHRGVIPGMKPAPEAVEKGVNLDLDLTRFLHDFIALMPLMHWLHQAVPQAETNKYLCAMQRMFYAHSIATEQTDTNLIEGLDYLLRALSNSPHFDGYSHEKLLATFQRIQSYLKSIGENHHLGDSFEWNLHELLTIPALQLEELIAQKGNGTPDYHAMRLMMALLQHGKKQRGSPKNYCELPQAVNHEFGDYLSLALSKNFGITVPDRLDHMLTSEIQILCEDAWNDFERPIDLKFFERVKLLVSSMFN
ncbi:MAG: SIR2 family protein [Mariprofundaceae bacterium]